MRNLDEISHISRATANVNHVDVQNSVIPRTSRSGRTSNYGMSIVLCRNDTTPREYVCTENPSSKEKGKERLGTALQHLFFTWRRWNKSLFHQSYRGFSGVLDNCHCVIPEFLTTRLDSCYAFFYAL